MCCGGEILGYRTSEQIIEEEKERIDEMLEKGYSKTDMAKELKTTRKTVEKVIKKIGVEYDFYKVNRDIRLKEAIEIGGDGVKMCNTCKEFKKYDEYYRHKKRGTFYTTCIDCTKIKEKIRYESRVKELQDYKESKGCKKCGETRPHTLDFHHLKPEDKKFTIAASTRTGLGSKSLQEEIAKCILLCSNCHRDFHHHEYHNGTDIIDYIG